MSAGEGRCVKRTTWTCSNTGIFQERINKIKELRERYNPRSLGLKIKILFIGESPPEDAPQVFFYEGTSTLYYATFIAFHKKFHIPEHAFLEFFKNLGCYLYDLLDVPGLRITNISLHDL